jgi:aminoglycoside phosphotransferase (APT) family kinase protein
LEARTFAFRLGEGRFVLKICDQSGDQVRTEFENLAAVSVANVPTPEPVLMDLGGNWFHVPAIVMTALHGQPDLHPRDRELWISGAADALASIHDIPVNRAGHVVAPRWQRWKPATEAMNRYESRVDAVLARLYERAKALPTVFSHDDFNPGNLLFHRGHLSGVVDWADIAIEPRQAAVALYRHFLVIHPGGRAPQVFLDAYEEAAGTSLDDMALWDVLYGLRGVRPVDHWVSACAGLGLEITSTEIQERSLAWVRDAVLLAGG